MPKGVATKSIYDLLDTLVASELPYKTILMFKIIVEKRPLYNAPIPTTSPFFIPRLIRRPKYNQMISLAYSLRSCLLEQPQRQQQRHLAPRARLYVGKNGGMAAYKGAQPGFSSLQFTYNAAIVPLMKIAANLKTNMRMEHGSVRSSLQGARFSRTGVSMPKRSHKLLGTRFPVNASLRT